jgi:membrane-bound lytic murein transglycosylase B
LCYSITLSDRRRRGETVSLRLAVALISALALLACEAPRATATRGIEQAAPSAGTTGTLERSFSSWLAALKTEALAAGVSAATFDRAFQGVRPDPDVLAKDEVQPEYTRPIWAYLDAAVSEKNIAEGRQRLTNSSALLKQATRPYGVDPRFVIAIWGLESAYGENTGGYNVIEALATLAYDSRRPEVFRRNLIEALLILEAGDITAAEMRGSWAGAMGQTQFMPATFRQHAVDGDGDGRRDIWGSLPDVFASTANYLAAFGWRPGEPWGMEVRLPANFPWDQAELDISKSIQEWSALGVRRANGTALPKTPAQGSIIAPAGHRGPAFIIFDNFRTILDYNNSVSYALAVGHLADRLGGGTQFVVQWPREELPLSRTDKLDMQNLLLARGYDPGDVDGVIGPQTRAAIRQFQREVGEVPDGFATVALLAKLRSLTAS